MKKIILFLILIATTLFAQNDPYISIGKLKLRYDADSNYLRIGYMGTLTGISNLRIGKELDGQLFKFNISHFSWSTTTGLNLSSTIFQQDSIASKNYTSSKDSSWSVLGETVSKWRFLTLKKPFWANPNLSGSQTKIDIPLWFWYYKSVSDAGVISGVDSFSVLNEASTLNADGYDTEFFGVDTWTTVDTLQLGVRAKYLITYDVNLIFPYVEVNGVDATDSVNFRMVTSPGTEDEYVLTGSTMLCWKTFLNTYGLVSQTYPQQSGNISRTFAYNFTGLPFTVNGTVYLQVRADLNTSLTTVALTKPQITYMLVR